eukprot:366095-Chlamydomonas_euryale.AAC.9
MGGGQGEGCSRRSDKDKREPTPGADGLGVQSDPPSRDALSRRQACGAWRCRVQAYSTCRGRGRYGGRVRAAGRARLEETCSGRAARKVRLRGAAAVAATADPPSGRKMARVAVLDVKGEG